MVCLDRVQNLHIHAVRARSLRDFQSIFGLKADFNIPYRPPNMADFNIPYRPPNMADFNIPYRPPNMAHSHFYVAYT